MNFQSSASFQQERKISFSLFDRYSSVYEQFSHGPSQEAWKEREKINKKKKTLFFLPTAYHSFSAFQYLVVSLHWLDLWSGVGEQHVIFWNTGPLAACFSQLWSITENSEAVGEVPFNTIYNNICAKRVGGRCQFLWRWNFYAQCCGTETVFEQGNANICFIKFSLPCFT